MDLTQHEIESDVTHRRRDPEWVVELIRDIQSGHDIEASFERLFRHYEPLCRGHLRRLYPTGDVDDLAQDVMVRVYKGIGTFRRDSSFHTWLLAIVKNVIRNAIRDSNTGKAKTHSAATSLEALLGSVDDEATPLDLESVEPDPLDLVLDEEKARHLEAALDELPERMRQSVELFLFHGFSQREIAQAQKTSVGTVKKQVVEGRKRLRTALSALTELFGLFILFVLFVG